MTELILICRVAPHLFGIEPHMNECFSSIEKAKEVLNKRIPEGTWICENTLYDADSKNIYILQKITYRG